MLHVTSRITNVEIASFQIQVAKQAYIGLDDTLFQHYVEEKSNPVVGALEHHMYAGQFDWNACYGCQGVRRYVKEALMGMIEVHAEVCIDYFDRTSHNPYYWSSDTEDLW